MMSPGLLTDLLEFFSITTNPGLLLFRSDLVGLLVGLLVRLLVRLALGMVRWGSELTLTRGCPRSLLRAL